jgi:hypothetical protein
VSRPLEAVLAAPAAARGTILSDAIKEDRGQRPVLRFAGRRHRVTVIAGG